MGHEDVGREGERAITTVPTNTPAPGAEGDLDPAGSRWVDHDSVHGLN